MARNREHLGPFLPWAWQASPEAQGAFIERSLEQFARGDGFQAGIWYCGELVGGVGLLYLHHVNARTEIGYWLAAEFEGRGIMTRTVAGLCRYLFEVEGMNRIEIRSHPSNARSRAIPERLGFTQEGILRQHVREQNCWSDHVVYALLKDDWRHRQEAA